MRLTVLLVIVVTACSLAVAACGGGSSATPTPTPPALATAADGNGNYPGVPLVTGTLQTTPSGLAYLDLASGSGPAVQAGQRVTVKWSGWIVNAASPKDSLSFTMGEQPSEFILGAEQVIRGLEEAVATMRVGGKRRVVLPPELGYGADGLQNANGFIVIVPPNATLVADIEVTAAGDPATPAASGTKAPGA